MPLFSVIKAIVLQTAWIFQWWSGISITILCKETSEKLPKSHLYLYFSCTHHYNLKFTSQRGRICLNPSHIKRGCVLHLINFAAIKENKIIHCTFLDFSRLFQVYPLHANFIYVFLLFIPKYGTRFFLEWDKSYGCICNILFLFFIIQQYLIFFINLLRGFFFFSSIWVHKHLSSSLLIALAFASLLIFLSFLFFVSKFDMVSASLFKC